LIRTLSINGSDIKILYIPQLTDRYALAQFLIKPLLDIRSEVKISPKVIAESVILIDEVTVDTNENKIIDYVLNGLSVILVSDHTEYIIASTKKIEKRVVNSPEVQGTIRGPRDAFTEDINTNLSLIRYRLKDQALKIEYIIVGKRTKTKVAILYMDDIANSNYFTQIKNRVKAIKVDGIIDSGYIQKFILNNAFNLFPQIGTIERPDSATAHLLEGKVCILVEGSNMTLVAPQTLLEFLDSGSDHYDNV